jgi:hypothetical protein
LEREVEGPGVVAAAYPDCYKLWREESMARQRSGLNGNTLRLAGHQPLIRVVEY